MSNNNTVFHSFRFPDCDTIINRTSNLQQRLTSCSEWVKHVYRKNVYQMQETLFDKLNSFGIEYTKFQALIEKIAPFELESIFVQEKSVKDIDTTKSTGKHNPIVDSISSNLIKQPTSLRNAAPHYVLPFFIAALENLASHSKVKRKSLFRDVLTAIKTRPERTFETFSHSKNSRGPVTDGNDDISASTQFLQMHENQKTDGQKPLERYCNMLPVLVLTV